MSERDGKKSRPMARPKKIAAPYVPVARVGRRQMLRAAGVAVGLPLLACMTPVFGQLGAGGQTDAGGPTGIGGPTRPPRRMLLLANNLGVLPKNFFPTGEGRAYQPSPYLEILQPCREKFTIFSGLSHPGVSGGHSADNCLLTAARGAFKSGFRNTISLDQFAADKLGQVTRFPTLNLGVNIDKGNRSLSWTRDGVLLPAEDSATRLYQRLFVQGDAESVARQVHRLENRGSILDTLTEETARFSRQLGREDRARLEQYTTSIREVEQRLQTAKAWEQRPKPKAPQPAPPEVEDKKLFFEKIGLMLQMAQLAFSTDATRIVTLMVDAFMTPAMRLSATQSATEGYHGLSHHGQAEAKVKQLEAIDRRQMELLRETYEAMAAVQEQDRTLLDSTMVFYGSNLGDANIHDNTNLPILLAGGGFRHGQHLAFRRDNNTPLCNLFVSMLQQMGLEVESFASSTGRLTGLESA